MAGEHYDEAMDLSASESMMSTDDPSSAIVVAKSSPQPEAASDTLIKNARHDEEIAVDSDEASLSSSNASGPRDSGPAKALTPMNSSSKSLRFVNQVVIDVN